MYTVTVEKRCGCFTRSGLESEVNIESKEEALAKAKEMIGHMNETFCKKHTFEIVEEGMNLKIVEKV